MTIIILIFGCLCLYKLKPCAENPDYLSRLQTQRINGIFVFLIFMSHFVTYISTDVPYMSLYMDIRSFLKQLVVATFLFFSGYGMYESFKKKGSHYISTLPQRFLKLLLQFDIAVFIFLIIALLFQKQYTLSRIILSFTGWQSIGNSNWYVFVILTLYVIMYIVFKTFKNKSSLSLIGFTLLTCLFIFFLTHTDQHAGWYNTMLCFPAGMWFSHYKESFEKMIGNSQLKYILILCIMVILFLVFHKNMELNLIIYELMSIFFCLVIVLLSKRFIIGSPVLDWLGHHVFSFYILQRIPMIIGQEIGLYQYTYIYFFVCLMMTIILVYIFDYSVSKLQRKIFK